MFIHNDPVGNKPASGQHETQSTLAGLFLGLRPANERRRYKVTPSLIDWAQT